MKKIYTMAMAMALMASETVAQRHTVGNATLVEFAQQSLSPSETRATAFGQSMHSRYMNLIYGHATAYEMERTADSLAWHRKHAAQIGHIIDSVRVADSLGSVPPDSEFLRISLPELGIPAFTADDNRALVSTSYGAGQLDGDFLPYQGRSSYDWRINGYGHKRFGNHGTLYGSVHYASGKHRGISWSAMRYPELFLPYAVTDSTGGDTEYESYSLKGGYSKRLGRWYIGVEGSFDGELAHRMTDPRLLNNITFLRLGAGVGRTLGDGHSLMMRGWYTRTKQYEHVRYWRPGEQQRFFVCYGFGLYDSKNSTVSFGRARMFYINGGSGQLTYVSPKAHKAGLMLNFGYDFSHLYTEESAILDLYASDHTTLTPALALRCDFSPAFGLRMLTSHNLHSRKGYERIFERYVTDSLTSSYDYRQISEQQDYDFTLSEGYNAIRAEWSPASRHRIGLQGGMAYTSRVEKQKKYGYKVENLNLTPHAHIDYAFRGKTDEVEVALQAGRQLSSKAKYDVEMKNNAIEHLDFQQTFAPYAFYAAEYTTAMLSATYTRRLRLFDAGLRFQGMVADGDRLRDAKYDKTIGYNSVCPMIDTQPGSHDEKWFNLALFVTY